MRTGGILIAMAALALAGLRGRVGRRQDRHQGGGATTATASTGVVTGKLPPGAVEPADPAEEQAEGPAATEASPEAGAEGPEASGELSGEDRTTAVAAVSDYIRALDRHDAARVCALLAPGALDLGALPRRRGGCRPIAARLDRHAAARRRSGVAQDHARRGQARGPGRRPRPHHRDGHPSLLGSQVRLGRGRRDLSGAGRRALAARQTERNALSRGRLPGASARRFHSAARLALATVGGPAEDARIATRPLAAGIDRDVARDLKRPGFQSSRGPQASPR